MKFLKSIWATIDDRLGASKLLGSVLGDPFAATSVSGLRERLERALP